jgi:hypothetical protein
MRCSRTGLAKNGTAGRKLREDTPHNEAFRVAGLVSLGCSVTYSFGFLDEQPRIAACSGGRTDPASGKLQASCSW